MFVFARRWQHREMGATIPVLDCLKGWSGDSDGRHHDEHERWVKGGGARAEERNHIRS